MSELLFLSHRIPYPPNKGDKIRSYHLLRHLSRKHTVHLGTFIDDPDDWAHTDALRALCGECCFLPLDRRAATLRSLRGFFTGEALTLPFYADRKLHRWVQNLTRTRKLDAALVYSSAMAQYVENLAVRRIADFVDVDSDKWHQYAAKLTGPRRWIYEREAKRLAAHESRIAGSFDATFLVSTAEAALMRRIAPQAAGRIHHFDNGVDTDYFSPERPYENPFPAEERSIVFTGAMDYWPNVDAVTWFADVILPDVRESHPDAVFTIVGSRPTDAVRALGERPGVRVTGSVPDVRPYLAHAAVAVAPLRIARGVQNKVLEAMAMGKVVVVTPEALEGIEAVPGKELILASDARGLSAAVSDVLGSTPPGLGESARRMVLRSHAWDANLEPVDRALARPAALGVHRSAPATLGAIA